MLGILDPRLRVAAWGRQGHEIVANLAWRILSNHTRTKVIDILQFNATTSSTRILEPTDTAAVSCESCSPLAWVADWADSVRHTQAYRWTSPLHYIDVRDDSISGGCPAGEGDDLSPECQFDYSRDCPDDICVAGAIVNYTDILLEHHYYESRDNPESVKLLEESLKFLVHYIGDIHQPLHASRTSDRGGNSIHVHFLNQRSNTRSSRRDAPQTWQVRRRHYANNLHSVWDDGIIEKCLEDDFEGSRVALEDELWLWMNNQEKSGEYRKKWLACPYGAIPNCANGWGQESFALALAFAYRNVDGTEILSGTNLTNSYYDTRLPVVKRQLAAGGIRLAVTLEVALQDFFGNRVVSAE